MKRGSSAASSNGLWGSVGSMCRLYALYHLVTFRGLRRGEAVGLPWAEVDLAGRSLTVTQQIVQLGYRTESGPPKSDSARGWRSTRTASTALRAHKARQAAERRAWGAAWVETGLVFTREDGSALHPEYVTRHFERLARDAGLPPIRLHDLRHGAATLALAGGADLKTVSEMLGHSTITITADTYASVLPEVAHRAAEAAARLVPRRHARRIPAARPHFGPIWPRKRRWPSAHADERPGQWGCAARDLNPQPAD